jgi:hypothetical protein
MAECCSNLFADLTFEDLTRAKPRIWLEKSDRPKNQINKLKFTSTKIMKANHRNKNAIGRT